MPESSLNAGIVIGAALGRTFGSTFKSVEQRSKKLGDALKKARLGTALTGDVVKYKQQLDQLRRKQAQAGGAGKKLTQQIAKAERQYRAAGQRAKRYGVEIGQAARRHREFSRTARDASRQLGRLQRQQREQSRMRQQAGGPRRIGTAVGLLGAGYAAGRIFRTSMGLEEQAIRLDTVINAEDGDTEAAVQRSVQHAREVARRTLSSEAELLEIQYELNSASLSESAARAGSEVVSKVATVTKGDVGQVGKILGGVFNNLGDTIEGSNVEEKLGRIGDVLTQVQFKFALSDFGQLGEGLAESAASASANRLSLERLGVAIGILNTAQVTGSRAGTAMNAVLRQMPKASEELGFTIQRNAEGNLNLGATLEGLRNSLSVYDDLDERNQVIQQLFGDEGMRGIIPLLEGVEQYKKGLESVGEAGGLVDKSYQKFLQSSGGDWKMLTQNVTAVSSTIGGTLLPAISAVLWPFGAAARVVGGLVDRFPVLGHVIGGVTVSIVGLMATGLATSYVSSLWNRFMDSNTLASRTMGAALNWTRARLVAFNRTALVTAARTKALAVGGAIQSFGSSLIGLATRAIPVAIGGLRALSVAALSNPIVLIGVAVAGAAIVVYKYWGPIKGFFKGLWGGIKTIFSAAWEGIKGFFLNYHPVGLVIKHWAPIVGFFGRLWTGIQSVFSAAWEGIKGFFLNYHPVGLVIKHWAPIVGFFGRLWTGIQSVFSAAWEGIKGFFLNYHPVGLVIKHWAPIVGFFGRLWTGIQSVFSAAWEGIKGFFLNYHPVGLVIKHWAPIVGFFGRLWTGIQSVFSAAWEGIKGFFLNYHPVGLVIKHWAPIVGFFGRLWTGIQSVFSAAWEGVVDWFGSLSLYEVGAAILTTLGEGIGSAVGWLGDKVKGVFGSIRKLLPFSDAKEGPLSGLTKSGQSILGTLGEGIRQAGPVALQRPLARTLGAATAGLALTLPIAASPAATSPTVRPSPVVSFDSQTTRAAGTRPASTTIHYHNQITIHQQPNEDPQALAERILREMTRLQKQRRREEVYDGL